MDMVEATLSYEAKRNGIVAGVGAYRNASLFVRRGGQLLIAVQISGGLQGDRPGGLLGSGTPPPKLTLEEVWGSREPEAVVEFNTGGQGCCEIVDVGLIDSHTRGRVLSRNFGAGWRGQRYKGRFEFVSWDYRFFCTFTSCAYSTLPLQIFAIDAAGRSFADVTRTRRQAIEAQADVIWNAYLRDYQRPFAAGPTEGELAAWCADQYLLERKARCDHVLRGTSPAFVSLLHARLAAWGYA
jgi:hypothetical protein